MVAYCDFDLHFLDDYLHWASFHMRIGHLYMIFEEMSVQVLSPFFKKIMFLLFCFYWAEPGGLPSVGLHWVGHDWSDLAAAAAASCNNAWERQSSCFAAKSLYLRFCGSPSYGFMSQHTHIMDVGDSKWDQGGERLLWIVKTNWKVGSFPGILQKSQGLCLGQGICSADWVRLKGSRLLRMQKLEDLVPSPETSQLAGRRGQHGGNP